MEDQQAKWLAEQQREQEEEMLRKRGANEQKALEQSAYRTENNPEDNMPGSLLGKALLLALVVTGQKKNLDRWGQKHQHKKEEKQLKKELRKELKEEQKQLKKQASSTTNKNRPAVSEAKSNVAQLSSGKPKRVVDAAKRTASRVANATKESAIRSLYAGHLKRGFSAVAAKGGMRIAAALNIAAPANKVAANGPSNRAGQKGPSGPKGPGG